MFRSRDVLAFRRRVARAIHPLPYSTITEKTWSATKGASIKPKGQASSVVLQPPPEDGIGRFRASLGEPDGSRRSCQPSLLQHSPRRLVFFAGVGVWFGRVVGYMCVGL